MNILGLDLGLDTGYAILTEAGKLIDSGTWLIGKKVDGQSLHVLRTKLSTVFIDGIDQVYYEGVKQHHRSRATASAFGKYEGILLQLCYEYNISVKPLSVGTIKKIFTGSGNATKDEMEAWVTKRYNMLTLDDNEADAIAVGFTGINK